MAYVLTAIVSFVGGFAFCAVVLQKEIRLLGAMYVQQTTDRGEP